MLMNDLIVKKRDGGELSTEEIDFMIQGYTRGEIPDYQMSAMCMAIIFRGMSDRETLNLTMSMMNSGETLDLSPINGIKADKHSTGGVGDKTSLILCPMVSACGVKIAKMSGRGLGHTGGTLDKLESFPGFNISIGEQRFFDNVNKHGISIIGQTADLDPADKKLYALRDVTGTVRKCAAVITDMDQPLGCAVGNSVEVKEAISVLKGETKGDLLELCLTLGSCILTEAGIAESIEDAHARLTHAVESGAALKKLAEMVSAQDGDGNDVYDTSRLPDAKVKLEVPSEVSGYIGRILAEHVGLVSMHLGGGRATKDSEIDLSVGVILHKKVGDKVEKGEILATIHASSEEKAQEAAKLLRDCYQFSDAPVERPAFIKAIVR